MRLEPKHIYDKDTTIGGAETPDGDWKHSVRLCAFPSTRLDIYVYIYIYIFMYNYIYIYVQSIIYDWTSCAIGYIYIYIYTNVVWKLLLLLAHEQTAHAAALEALDPDVLSGSLSPSLSLYI